MNGLPQNVIAAAMEPFPWTFAGIVPELKRLARADDCFEAFPAEAIALLQSVGCLTAVLPKSWGGRCLGWDRASRETLLELLQAIGGVHLSAARLFEGHVNAFQLLWLYGSSMQRESICYHVREGNLLGVWNAPSPLGQLRLLGEPPFRLQGSKAYASGAGHIRRPLVTAHHEQLGLVMIWANGPYEVGPKAEWTMQGMRSTMTRSVMFASDVTSDQIFGVADDYHQQPTFSGGAWRFLAAQLGAGRALLELMRQTLVDRGRSEDPHQRARMAEGAVAIETGRMWVSRASCAAFEEHTDASNVVAQANMARMAVERLLLDVLEIVQRSVGLSAFARDNDMERIARDLATYLRQPAPDSLRDAIGKRAFSTPSHPTPSC